VASLRLISAASRRAAQAALITRPTARLQQRSRPADGGGDSGGASARAAPAAEGEAADGEKSADEAETVAVAVAMRQKSR